MNTDKHRIRNDLILIGTLLVIALAAFIFVKINKSAGDYAVVYVDTVEEARFSLSEDTEYEINGANGGINTLVISNGSAFLEDADCPDRLCVKQGSISNVGESIICLPHKVVIAIESGDDEEAQYDGVAK